MTSRASALSVLGLLLLCIALGTAMDSARHGSSRGWLLNLGGGIGWGTPIFLATSIGAGLALAITKSRERALITWSFLILTGFVVLGIGAEREIREWEVRAAAVQSQGVVPPQPSNPLCQPFNPPPYDYVPDDYEGLLAQMCDRNPLKVEGATLFKEYQQNELQMTHSYRWRFIQLSGRVDTIARAADDVAVLGFSVQYDPKILPGRITARFLREHEAPLRTIRRGQEVDIACWLGYIGANNLELRNCELVGTGSEHPAR